MCYWDLMFCWRGEKELDQEGLSVRLESIALPQQQITLVHRERTWWGEHLEQVVRKGSISKYLAK